MTTKKESLLLLLNIVYVLLWIKFDIEATLKPEKQVYFLKHLLALLKVREISVFNRNRVTEAACALNTAVTLSVIHVETNLVWVLSLWYIRTSLWCTYINISFFIPLLHVHF